MPIQNRDIFYEKTGDPLIFALIVVLKDKGQSHCNDSGF